MLLTPSTPATAKQPISNYVGGRWVTPKGTESLPIDDPATGDVLGRVPLSTPPDVGAAVGAAKEAFPAWRATPAIERARGRVVTVAIDAMTFHAPIYVGDLVSLYAASEKVGRTSITVKIETIARRGASGAVFGRGMRAFPNDERTGAG